MVQQEMGQRWIRHSEAAARWAGVVVAATGLVGLAGWWADVAVLRAVVSGLAEMKPNTALGLALTGAALSTGAGREHLNKWRLACGCVVTFFGVATLLQYAFDIHGGIDRLLIGARHAEANVRMTIGASTAFACIGTGLVLTSWPPRPVSPARSAESTVGYSTVLIGSLALLGYLYGVRSLYQTTIFPSMAIHTALALTTAGAALLLSRPHQGLARLIGDTGAGGSLARRLLAFFLVLAPLLGWFRLQGQIAGLYDTAFGLALLVWFMILLGVTMVWWTASTLEKTDAWRAALQEDLASSISREHATAAQRGSILDALPTAIALLDENGRVLSVNRHWKSVVADPATAKRAVGERFADWAGAALTVERGAWLGIATGVQGVLDSARSGYLCEVSVSPRATQGEQSSNGNGGGGNGNGHTSPADRERWLEVRVAPVISGEGSRVPGAPGIARGAVVMVSDITQRRRLEEQLVHAQRLEAVGRLAGGVAHDFNNLLTAVVGNSALAQAEVDAGRSPTPSLKAIEQAARSGAELTQELLAFGRRQILSTRVVNIADLIANVRRLTDRSFGETINLTVYVDPSAWPARVDAGRIEQVLMNLVLNARDAIQQGVPAGNGGPGAAHGSIAIEAGNTVLDEHNAHDRPGIIPGRYICISVSDNGVGMSRDVMARVFEPFFTTKEHGKGTGLGLATSFGIVKQHNGHIAVYSEEGRGTTFRVFLPAAEGATVEGRPEQTTPKAERGSERVLLVDDHPGARAAVAGMLRSLGYTVIEAGDIAEAERLAKSEGPALDLLLSDVVLPDGKGPQLANRVAPVCTNAAVIYISGYTANAIANQGELADGVNFLSKPFSREELAAKVRAVLKSRPAV